MVNPAVTTVDKKLYPETLYYGKRVSESGHQPVYKKLLPDGEPQQLSPKPSQKLINHSPSGFQWGFTGSGPSQLSLALLLDATNDPEKAKSYYQDFKWEYVSGWGEQWAMTREVILEWIFSCELQETIQRQGKN